MIEINNLTKNKISKNFLGKVIRKGLEILKIKTDLSVALIGERRIKTLNKTYLKRNRATDVLSFPGQDNFLGEIVISLSQAKKQAKKMGHSLKKELKILAVHSLLHLLGFDHQKEKDKEKMEKVENKVLEGLKI